MPPHHKGAGQASGFNGLLVVREMVVLYTIAFALQSYLYLLKVGHRNKKTR
jgi:hypothetical protein